MSYSSGKIYHGAIGPLGMDPVLPARAGVLIMKNGDVYSIADNADEIVLLGVKNTEAEGLLPHVPVKIEALCGQKIRG